MGKSVEYDMAEDFFSGKGGKSLGDAAAVGVAFARRRAAGFCAVRVTKLVFLAKTMSVY